MADAWNALRREALDEGVRKLLIKSLAREASIAMERESLAYVRLECGQKLWDRIAVAPWRPEVREDHRDDHAEDDVEVRVLAAVYGPGDPPTKATKAQNQ